jgi:uncharacterized protein (DUF1501 family)
MRPHDQNRRHFLRAGAASAAVSVSGWLDRLAQASAADPARKRACILLWMNGGPSTIDLFDPKPGHANGGPTQPLKTSAPGLTLTEHLPKLAKFADTLAVVRSMSTKEGDHGRATYLQRTGQRPGGPILYPALGALVSKELGDPSHPLPNFVSVAPARFFTPDATGPGFLGPQHAPLVVGESSFGEETPTDVDQRLTVRNLARPGGVTAAQSAARLDLLRLSSDKFAADHPGAVAAGHAAAYDRAARLMRSDAARAFDLTAEPAPVRDRYGRTLFGQGCLLARRLVERGVPFVEVTLSGWDTHNNNFDAVKRLGETLDAGWAGLMGDLAERGLLATTTVLWMGEFGRTPKINNQRGRDHYPAAWSAVLAGGGVKGGQAVGKTSPDGTTVETRPTTTQDLLATLCVALGLNPETQNLSNVGRPIRLVEKTAVPLREVVG